MPTNSMLVQRGGMAPISYPGLLLDASAREQAQMGPLDKAFAELPSVIPTGGRRSRKHRSIKHHKHRSIKHRKQKHSRQSRSRHRSRHRSRRQSRKQQGGMAPFNDAYTFSPNFSGQNPQWQSVSNVGAQAPGPIDVV